jgi:alkylated DNA repair dioxygenase AlkB
MSFIPRQYQYIENGPVYDSIDMHPLVTELMDRINEEFGYSLDVCFLNYYADQKKALGWHADDSEPIDQTQPIAVISFGQPREIWWKPNDFKGVIPHEWRQLLGDGSLFIMPAGMQDTHKHRIPKGDHEMGPRISLTYRAWRKDI